MHAVGDVGGIIGAAVSGSFLFIVGLANSVILWRILMQRRQISILQLTAPKSKGFDTASSIALLALSALAKRGPDGKSIPSSNIVILPLLFTAGMTLVDSTNSILMLYSYAGLTERSSSSIERRAPKSLDELPTEAQEKDENNNLPGTHLPHPHKESGDHTGLSVEVTVVPPSSAPADAEAALRPPNVPLDHHEAKVLHDKEVKMNVMSGISIILTIMSILVAFRCLPS
ncbi:hypothetical protein H0H93_003456 [Arthromyces matolae]|nr:hypothetical protein H0H93_003456 [Arthromyces matolae]